jgi:hypothetical protein
MPTGGLLAGLLDRRQQPRIGQQPVQRRQIRWQLADLDRQQPIEQRLHLPARQPQHPSLPLPCPDGPNHPLTRNGMLLSPDYFRGK